MPPSGGGPASMLMLPSSPASSTAPSTAPSSPESFVAESLPLPVSLTVPSVPLL